jgi:prephenate dehydratase
MVARPRYAYLGPAGTFTEAAVRQVADPDVTEYLPQPDVVAALDAVRSGDAEFAVVAIENSVEGSVTAVLDTLAAGDLMMVHEVVVPVSFDLAARDDTEISAVRRISAHPHAWAQCRHWLAAHLPGATHVAAASNTSGAQLLTDPDADVDFDAVLVPPAALDVYPLHVLAEGVADNPNAVTRFVVVATHGPVPAPTGADKTSLVVHLPDNEAGALLTMLEQFATRGVNLSRIESRPIGDALGRYSFSIDAEGHIADARMGEALMGLRRVCPVVRFLGSYPRADGVTATVASGTSDTAFADAAAWLARLRSATCE